MNGISDRWTEICLSLSMLGAKGPFELQLADQGLALERTVFHQASLVTEDTGSPAC